VSEAVRSHLKLSSSHRLPQSGNILIVFLKAVGEAMMAVPIADK